MPDRSSIVLFNIKKRPELDLDQGQLTTFPEQAEIQTTILFDTDNLICQCRWSDNKTVGKFPILGFEKIETSRCFEREAGLEIFINPDRQRFAAWQIVLKGKLGKDFCLRGQKKRNGDIGDQHQDQDNCANNGNTAKRDNPFGDTIVPLDAA